jgi:uncharacterized iron-regulated protein
MKSIFFLFVFLIPSSILIAQNKPAYVLYNSKGKKVKYAKMIKKVSESDVLFFGEQHNNPISHWLQIEATKDLFAMKGQNLVLGAEMIETDNQELLNQFLSGEKTEEDFEAEARLWNNYQTDYKPLVLFAKDNNLPFIASNIPRRYASMVYKQGIESLDTLDADSLAFIAPLPIEIDLELPGYQAMLEMMGGHGAASENLPKAQAVKDATMGYSITKNWQTGKYFIHYNGAYHSDNYEGTVWYVKKYNPSITFSTITTVMQKDVSKLEKENMGKADYIICVPENMTTTY